MQRQQTMPAAATPPVVRSMIARGVSEGRARLRGRVRVAPGGEDPDRFPRVVFERAPELGADNLEKGLRTGVIAFSIVGAFMVVYYFSCGIIAVIALACTGVFILGAMALNKAAFTMPGIAGVVLTFGQAVDANVLIYERMREELKRGDDMRSAVRIGFQRARPAIVDANVSHLIICFVLYNFGTQEIRGFAIVLTLGRLPAQSQSRTVPSAPQVASSGAVGENATPRMSVV